MVSCGTPGCSCNPIPYKVEYCPGCGGDNFWEDDNYSDEYHCLSCYWEGEILPFDQPID